MTKPWWRAVLRLFAALLAVGMAASRLGLVAHELVGHGGTAIACGGEITNVRLFWFAGGWISYQFDEASVAVATIVSLGGIALEVVVGLGLLVGLSWRPDGFVVRIVRGIGAAILLHGCWYFATGTWHGFGDGAASYHLLGDARWPAAIAVGLLAAVAGFIGARLTFGTLAAEVPGTPRVKTAGVVIAMVATTALLTGLSIGELQIRGDARYGAIMQTEGARETQRELTAWRKEQARNKVQITEAQLEAERARIAALHSEPPFRVPLSILIGLAVIAGAVKARPGPMRGMTTRQLAIAGALAVGSIGAVIAIDAAFYENAAMAERTVKDLLGGGLRPNDPRRFLIEAMICAINADGVVDERETAVLERQIAQHPMFQGLGQVAARTLVELSNDAIKFAGSALGRAPAIAKGLPARIHRLAAFSMAAEVAAADQHIDGGELTFLEALRIALRISPAESNRMIDAAKAGWVAGYLDDRYLRIKGLIAPACEVFALRALARGMATDEQRHRVRDFFAAIPDLALTRDELDAELYRAFRRPRAPDAQVFSELQAVANGLRDPVDRYWMMVYTLVAEMPATVPSWRVIPFVGVMQAAMQITDTDMELAAVDALTFAPALPRPN